MPILQAEQIMLNDPAHARGPHEERYALGSAFINGQYCGVHEAAIPIVDMGFMHADEAFMTSPAGAVMPINSVDDTVLGGEPGPGAITTQLHNRYWERRWEGWLGTPVDYETNIEVITPTKMEAQS